jgi:hypothetical protein
MDENPYRAPQERGPRSDTSWLKREVPTRIVAAAVLATLGVSFAMVGVALWFLERR